METKYDKVVGKVNNQDVYLVIHILTATIIQN